MQKKWTHISLIFIGLLFWQACEEPDCEFVFTSTVNLTFYTLSENEPDEVFVRKISAVGVTDTLILENAADVSAVALPVNPDSSVVTFVFDIVGYGVDTLTLSYQNGVRLISEECGFEQIYSDLEYVRSDFDSISIRNRILAEQIDEDIRIYNN